MDLDSEELNATLSRQYLHYFVSDGIVEEIVAVMKNNRFNDNSKLHQIEIILEKYKRL